MLPGCRWFTVRASFGWVSWVPSLELTGSELISSRIVLNYRAEPWALPPCSPKSEHLFFFFCLLFLGSDKISFGQKVQGIQNLSKYAFLSDLNCYCGASQLFGYLFYVPNCCKIYLLKTAILFCSGVLWAGNLGSLCWGFVSDPRGVTWSSCGWGICCWDGFFPHKSGASLLSVSPLTLHLQS